MAETADTTISPAGQGALTIADLNTTVNCEARVEDLKLGFSLGMKNPASAMRQLIQRHWAALERFGPVSATVAETSRRGGRPGKTYWLNKRQALFICTKSETPNATEATIQMVEVFDEYLRGTFAQPALPAPSPTLDRSGLALMRVGRRTVLVNTKRFRLGPGEQAVRMHHDGRLSIGRVSNDPTPPRTGTACALRLRLGASREKAKLTGPSGSEIWSKCSAR